jgi:acetyl-CoA carboxylase carboxyl transferase subunit alpha
VSGVRERLLAWVYVAITFYFARALFLCLLRFMPTISHPLEFELPLVQLEKELEQLRDEIVSGDQSRLQEFAQLEARVVKTKNDLYGKLTPIQRVQLSRHFDRPFSLDFIALMATDFLELHGDRAFRDDPAIVGGIGKIGSLRVMFVGHQRGRTTQERLERNFGMPQPEGYRKALRLFRLAEKFSIPIVTLIDTQGAFPGLEAEERGQAEAIARNLIELAQITVPVVSVVIGEGGSGGALALGVADRILMLENACYSVITPEGCASILWRGAEYAGAAAEALKVTARDLLELGVIEEVVAEPSGGAHRNHAEAAEILKAALVKNLEEIADLNIKDLLDKRYAKYRGLGAVSGN